MRAPQIVSHMEDGSPLVLVGFYNEDLPGLKKRILALEVEFFIRTVPMNQKVGNTTGGTHRPYGVLKPSGISITTCACPCLVLRDRSVIDAQLHASPRNHRAWGKYTHLLNRCIQISETELTNH